MNQRTLTAVCPFCAVGCGLSATAGDDGSLIFRGQPEHVINHGLLCARGAAATFEPTSRQRLLAPLLREPGAASWRSIDWDEALDRAAAALLDARRQSWDETLNAAPGLAFLGGATAMNEEAYFFARMARQLGALYVDHQGRLCHSATTTALGATLGLAAATHTWDDLAEAQWLLVLGSNPSEAHPIAAHWMARARKRGAVVLVADPRTSKTAQAAELHLPLRPGTDVALLGGLIHAVLLAQAEDTEFLERATDALRRVRPEALLADGCFGGYNFETRSYDTTWWEYQESGITVLDAVRQHFARYTVSAVCAITGLCADDFAAAARIVTERRRGAVLFSMGVTQQTAGVAGVRAAAILQALLGNLMGAGGGLYPMKGHANIQGATDLGGLWTQLPAYLPAPTAPMTTIEQYRAAHGTQAAAWLDRLMVRWYDGQTIEPLALLGRRAPAVNYSMTAALGDHSPVRALVLLGQNPLRGMPQARARFAQLDTLVVIDPMFTDSANFWEDTPDCATMVLALPAAAFSEKPGSRTNACRQVQWQHACEIPRGQARADLCILTAWLERCQAAAPASDLPLRRIRLPRSSDVAALYREVLDEIDTGCWLYAGVAAGIKDGGQWCWPAGQRRLLDTPLPNAVGRIRLWTAPLRTEAAVDVAIPNGPLPEYYEPLCSPHAAHPHDPTWPATGRDTVSERYPLLLSTAIVSGADRRCPPRGGARDNIPVIGVPRSVAETRGVTAGQDAWLETPTARGRVRLDVVPDTGRGDQVPILYAPSHWHGGLEPVFHDAGDPETLMTGARLLPCQLHLD